MPVTDADFLCVYICQQEFSHKTNVTELKAIHGFFQTQKLQILLKSQFYNIAALCSLWSWKTLMEVHKQVSGGQLSMPHDNTVSERAVSLG